MAADASQIDKPVNGSEQVVLRDVIRKRELVEQRRLRFLPRSHHRRSSHPLQELNQRDTRRSSESFSTEYALSPEAVAGAAEIEYMQRMSGGGERYCEACAQSCPDCPARLNLSETPEGWQVWDLVGPLGGQLRVLPGAVIGWDMSAALAMAELLPVIEAEMMRRLNEETVAKGGPGLSPRSSRSG